MENSWTLIFIFVILLVVFLSYTSSPFNYVMKEAVISQLIFNMKKYELYEQYEVKPLKRKWSED